MHELLKKRGRLEYRKNIPEWFKDGLDEYLTFSTGAIKSLITVLPKDVRESAQRA